MLPTRKCERLGARALDALGRDGGVGPGTQQAATHFQVFSCDEFIARATSAVENFLTIPRLANEFCDLEALNPFFHLLTGIVLRCMMM